MINVRRKVGVRHSSYTLIGLTPTRVRQLDEEQGDIGLPSEHAAVCPVDIDQILAQRGTQLELELLEEPVKCYASITQLNIGQQILEQVHHQQHSVEHEEAGERGEGPLAAVLPLPNTYPAHTVIAFEQIDRATEHHLQITDQDLRMIESWVSWLRDGDPMVRDRALEQLDSAVGAGHMPPALADILEHFSACDT